MKTIHYYQKEQKKKQIALRTTHPQLRSDRPLKLIRYIINLCKTPTTVSTQCERKRASRSIDCIVRRPPTSAAGSATESFNNVAAGLFCNKRSPHASHQGSRLFHPHFQYMKYRFHDVLIGRCCTRLACSWGGLLPFWHLHRSLSRHPQWHTKIWKITARTGVGETGSS